ncbi:MAG: hypothetical protein CBC02_008450 [Flavobacteriaceae bacterium TMED42]|nr:MAG: hypothetical protein CBC02_008450 [Flavobacteriaceae bacterium TMED42]
MQDSWEQREEMWDDHFAKDDAIRERYASELEDIKAMERADFYEMEYRQLVIEAGFPDTLEGMGEYEAMWKRTFEYAQSGAIDDLLENVK